MSSSAPDLESSTQLSDIGQIRQSAISAAFLGDLDACRFHLGRADVTDHERAWLYCQLSEALYHNGIHDNAVECARIAFDLQPEKEEIANLCAWVFSNCGRHEEAAAAYERLLVIRSQWAAGHRHASGSFAAAGQFDHAIFHGRKASDLDPHSFEFAFHAACLLEAAGRHAQAVDYFMRAAALDPADACVLRHLSAALFALERGEQAVALALRAVTLAPSDRLSALHATELLLRTERYDEAAAIILDAVAVHREDHVALRLLSATQMLRGRAEEALDAIDRAITLAPETTEYLLHRANLLYRLGRLEEAAETFGRAAALDPSNPDTKRSQLTVYFDSGRFIEALAVGGELIRTSPDNEEYAQAVLQVLNRRFEMLDGDYVVLSERALRSPRQLRPQPTIFAALHTQARVIYALIIRETRTRFADSKLGYGWALLEPVLHILMLSVVFAVLMRGRPPIGNEFFIFYYTGIIPYHLFVHTSSNMTYAITGNLSLLQLPLVSTFDVIMARGLVELLTDTLVAVILLAGFGAIGLGVLPHDLPALSASVIAVWLLGCGLGFINAVLNAFFKSWDKIWAQLTRALYFCSGIFYVPGMMPDWVRDILVWNPILHAVDWFRSSFFPEYEPHWLDRSYLAIVAAVTVVAGLGFERALRRHLYEPL
ncbi:MAG TPA: tetratricopeptide repeat protein [Stellaceae bacterium]|nr:tetratricopeptide repeat protein [Stellaceae bacterium]